MYNIYFKNGLKRTVDEFTAKTIYDAVCGEGSPKFQGFQDSNEKVLKLINVDDIVYIGEKENGK